MEVYVIGEKKDFTEEQIKRLEKVGSLNFIEEKHDMYNSEYVKSNEPKIIAVHPLMYILAVIFILRYIFI